MSKKKKRKFSENFSGLTIPRELLHARGLSLQQKAFLAEIDKLNTDNKGCWASLQYFADFFMISRRRVITVINQLSEAGLVESWADPQHPNVTRRRIIKEKIETEVVNKSSLLQTAQGGEYKFTAGSDQKFTAGGEQNDTKVVNISSPALLKERDNTKTIIENIEESIEKKQLISDDDLVLDLKKRRAEWELEFFGIIKPRTRSEKTTFQRLGDHFEGLYESQTDIFERSLEAAAKARQCGDKPLALFVSMAKERWGFKGCGGRLLKNFGLKVKGIRQQFSAMKEGRI